MREKEQSLRFMPKAVGAKQALRAVRDHRAEEVLLAADAEERVTEPVMALCRELDVPVRTVATAKELGLSCGIQVGAAVVALLKKEEK